MISDKTVGWEPAEPNACGHCGKTAPCECDNNRDGRNKKLGYLYPSSSLDLSIRILLCDQIGTRLVLLPSSDLCS